MSPFKWIFNAVLCLALPLAGMAGVEVLKPLAARCDLIDDEIVGKATGKKARLAALRCMAGQIGPVNYVHEKSADNARGGQSSSFGTIISEERARQLGGPKIPPPAGRYLSKTPASFGTDFKAWLSSAKNGEPEASGEIAATYFLEAQPKSFSFSEERMFKCFKLVGESGNVDAKFMTGVCLFYGIGCSRDKRKAYQALKDWKVSSGTTKANRDGWIARRFAEINK